MAVFRSGAPLWLPLTVRLYEIRRTIEITLETIEISSPNFICSFNGQIYTHLIFWLLTSKLKLSIKRSKLKLFSGIWRIIEITVEPIEISSTNLICTFKGQFYTHFIFQPFTSKVKLLSKGQNLLFKRSKLFFWILGEQLKWLCNQ